MSVVPLAPARYQYFVFDKLIFSAWPNSWNSNLTCSNDKYYISSLGKFAIKYATPLYYFNKDELRSVIVEMFCTWANLTYAPSL